MSFILLYPSHLWADPHLPKTKIEGIEEDDLPVPYSVQVTVLKRDVALSWKWQAPEEAPIFDAFGFEVWRDSHPLTMVGQMAFSDLVVPLGTHTYQVRVRGNSKERGKKIAHLSDWSEPVQATVVQECLHAPSVTLNVESTKHSYSSIPSLRLHLTGDVQIPKGCSLTSLIYRVDNGTGITHKGPLTTNSRDHFDDFVDAIQPDDEVPQGSAVFTITATAEDEAGPTTSNAYNINVELANPFAPKTQE